MTTERLLVHPAEFWSANETLKKIHSRKLCLAAGRGDCKGPIIEAHTIPRSQLRNIAKNGCVYWFRATPGDLLKNNGQFTVDQKGISEFSVLNFFCAKHDRELFSRVENDKLTFDCHQLALLHYRAMAAELYKKMNALEGARYNTERLQKQRRKDKEEKLVFLRAFEHGNELGLRDMARTFAMCETILANQDYERVSGVVVRFNKMPTIMTVGGFSPEFDYNGRLLQRLGMDQSTYEQIGLSILATEDRAAVIFTWLADAEVCRTFVASFISQNPSVLSTLAIQTAFEHLENTCMNIDWWDTLKQIERQKLLERMQAAGSPFQERASACLQFCGINFSQWDYRDFTFIESKSCK
jgi:hypothetical protein